MDVRDVETLASCQPAHLRFLLVGEVRTVALVGNSIAHCVVEDSLEAVHAEGNVQETVVDGGSDALRAHQHLL